MITDPAQPNSPAQPFRQWLHGDSLTTALKRAEEHVRQHPTKTAARWLLFELLCIQGNWERALKQLQTWATLSPESDGVAQTMRGLIRAERQRTDVFLGRQAPVPVVDLPPWMTELAQAIRLNANSQTHQADLVRAHALDRAPDVKGLGNLGAFDWIADSDTRLGPVCELIAQGSYRWLGFHDVRSIRLAAPERLIDLVWSSAQIMLFDGTPLRAFLPTRYPVLSPEAGIASDEELLSHQTSWTDVGETGVFGSGQKIWITSQRDWPLLEVRDCSFHAHGDTTRAAGDDPHGDASPEDLPPT